MPRIWYHVEILADVNDIVEVGKVIARVETSTSKIIKMRRLHLLSHY